MGNQQGKVLKKGLDIKDGWILGVDYLVCPVCGMVCKKITGGHLATHNLNIKSFREMFGNIPTECESHIKKKSDKEKEVMSSESFRKHRSDYATELWKDKNIRDSRIKSIREHHKDLDFRKECSLRSKKLWKEEDFRNKTVSRMLESNKTDEVKRKRSDNMKRLWSDPGFARKVFDSQSRWIKYECVDGSILYLKSTYEETACSFLDTLHIKYLYERRVFKYCLDGCTSSYFPDFYLPEYELFLEVKPEKLQNTEIAIAKFNSVLDSGYNIIFIGETELDNIDSFYNKILSSTTIP